MDRSICTCCCTPVIVAKSTGKSAMEFGGGILLGRWRKASRSSSVRASTVDSDQSSSNFTKRMEQAWLISQQPRPVSCCSCDSKGEVECKWCAGTGFFILGNNLLCEVPSRNTSCVICSGKGSACCSDCKGTGFRAKWLDQPPISK